MKNCWQKVRKFVQVWDASNCHRFEDSWCACSIQYQIENITLDFHLFLYCTIPVEFHALSTSGLMASRVEWYTLRRVVTQLAIKPQPRDNGIFIVFINLSTSCIIIPLVHLLTCGKHVRRWYNQETGSHWTSRHHIEGSIMCPCHTIVAAQSTVAVPCMIMVWLTKRTYSRVFPKVDRYGNGATMVLEQNKFSKK